MSGTAAAPKKPYKKKRKPNVGGDMYFVNCLRAVLGLDRLPGTLDEPPKRNRVSSDA